MNANPDPRYLYPAPPYRSQKNDPPGDEADLETPADHGEKTYEGHGVLKGKRALITGGDSGIGRAVAIAFAKEGADVAISYLSEKIDADETLRLLSKEGVKSFAIQKNINSLVSCSELASEALQRLGGIDILVNNAAYQRTYESLEEVPDEEFEETFRVNVFAPFRLSKALLPHMKPGGSIINTASIQSFDPTESLIAYAASKSALTSLTRSMAGLAIQKGIRVNAVAPGPIWTPLIPSTMPKEKAEKFGEHTVFGRAGQPAEMAPIFVFLASPMASYVTGEVYGGTGGQMPV